MPEQSAAVLSRSLAPQKDSEHTQRTAQGEKEVGERTRKDRPVVAAAAALAIFDGLCDLLGRQKRAQLRPASEKTMRRATCWW